MLDTVMEIASNEFVGTAIAVISPQLKGAAIVTSILASAFLGRKQIFLKVIMRFFPDIFVRSMRDMGESCNRFFEAKKQKGKFKKRWQIAEQKLIDGIATFNNELKK